MATLKVNLVTIGNACTQASTPANQFPRPGWYAFLYSCDGKLFEHAGKTYGPIPIDHGYVEIKDVPPGRYLVHAMLNPFRVQSGQGDQIAFQANYTSHYAVIDVCCGCEDLCVTLANPGWHYCVRVIIDWFRMLARQARIGDGLVPVQPARLEAAIGALEAVQAEGGEPLVGDAEIVQRLPQITDQFLAQAEQGE